MIVTIKGKNIYKFICTDMFAALCKLCSTHFRKQRESTNRRLDKPAAEKTEENTLMDSDRVRNGTEKIKPARCSEHLLLCMNDSYNLPQQVLMD